MADKRYSAVHMTEAVTPQKQQKDGSTTIEVEAVPVSTVGSNTGLKDVENQGTKRIFEEHNAIKLVPGLSLEDRSNIVDRWFYSYLDPVFRTGNSRTLMMEDLGAVNARDKCSYVEANFDKYWTEEMKLPKRKQSLWRVLWRTVGYDQLFYSMSYYAIYVGVTYGPILILNALVQHFQGTHLLSQVELWIFVCLVFVLPMLGSVTAAMSNAVLAHVSGTFLQIFAQFLLLFLPRECAVVVSVVMLSSSLLSRLSLFHQCSYHHTISHLLIVSCSLLIVQFRNVLVTKIYRKSLALSPAARQKSSTGQVCRTLS